MDNESTPVLVINELLCYMINKFGKYPQRHLGTILINFYSSDKIVIAKELLVKNIDDMNIGRWPRPARRRNNSFNNDFGNKAKQDIEDILNTLMFVDEQKLFDRLPRYVAANPDLVPSANWSEGDVIGIMNKFSSLEEQLVSIRSFMDNYNRSSEETQRIMDELRANREEIKDLKSFANNKESQSTMNHPVTSRFCSEDIPHAWNRHLALPNDADQASFSDTQTDEERLPFSTIISKKRRRMLTSELRDSAKRKDNTTVTVCNNQTLPSAIPLRLAVTKKKQERAVGKSSTIATLKAARDLTKKAVFCISNVDTDVSAEVMSKFIKSLQVRVISLFDAKTRFPNSKAFRVCINRDAFLIECRQLAQLHRAA